MARALLISNPVAARTDEDTRLRVAEFLGRAGWKTEIAVTSGPEDARALAREAVVSGVDAVAVFGGDGTTMGAAASLVGTEVALALIPGGTGNLLAGNLRIPSDPMRAARVLIEGKRRVIDLGRMEQDRPTLTCLRSVLMKPEHKEWADRIWEILSEATDVVSVR